MMMTISGSAAHITDTFSATVETQIFPSILLVNQDAHLLGKRLAAQGFVVRTACDGRSALEELRRTVPDAIVIDIDSPGVSGVALAEELRGWGFPIVVTTSWQERPVIAGAEFLEKPFKSSELVDLLTLAIDRGRVQAQLPAPRTRRHVLSR
jgi:DNA-binding response OmpR family regulator